MCQMYSGGRDLNARILPGKANQWSALLANRISSDRFLQEYRTYFRKAFQQIMYFLTLFTGIWMISFLDPATAAYGYIFPHTKKPHFLYSNANTQKWFSTLFSFLANYPETLGTFYKFAPNIANFFRTHSNITRL